MATLNQSLGSLMFSSPITVASGPLTDHVDLIKKAEECGAGAVSTKLTLYHQPIKGVRRISTEYGKFVYNPSDRRNDFEEGLSLVRQAKEAVSIPIFANIAGPGDNLEGWQAISKGMQEAGADALELNFCCPNTAFGKDACGNVVDQSVVGAQVGRRPDLIEKIVAAVKSAVEIPVWTKSTSMGIEYEQAVRACAKGGADGFVAHAGGAGVPPIDIYRRGKIKMNNLGNAGFGGYVGAHNRANGQRLTAVVAKHAPGIFIAGGGGICAWQDMVELIMYGAHLVGMCSKLMWDGFEIIPDLNAKLLQFMEEQGYETLDEMRGLALSNLVPPDKLKVYDAYPQIDEEQCVACGKCAKIGFCRALSMKQTAVLDPALCAKCGFCGFICPAKAISFNN